MLTSGEKVCRFDFAVFRALWYSRVESGSTSQISNISTRISTLGGKLDLYAQKTYNEPGWRDKQGLLPESTTNAKLRISQIFIISKENSYLLQGRKKGKGGRFTNRVDFSYDIQRHSRNDTGFCKLQLL